MSRLEDLAAGWEWQATQVHSEQARVFRLCAARLRREIAESDFGLRPGAWIVVCGTCEHAPHDGARCGRANRPDNPVPCPCDGGPSAQVPATDEALIAALTEEVALEVARAQSIATRGDDRMWRKLATFMQRAIARKYLKDCATTLPIVLRHWRGLTADARQSDD